MSVNLICNEVTHSGGGFETTWHIYDLFILLDSFWWSNDVFV